jgi:PHD/YefM family antitoxin component YafN of YafNO toxin-antitoxin module
MIVYTYSEARRQLASLLDKALADGEVLIKRRDGQVFVLRPQERQGSPLDVETVEMDVTTAEIVAAVRESRQHYER